MMVSAQRKVAWASALYADRIGIAFDAHVFAYFDFSIRYAMPCFFFFFCYFVSFICFSAIISPDRLSFFIFRCFIWLFCCFFVAAFLRWCFIFFRFRCRHFFHAAFAMRFSFTAMLMIFFLRQPPAVYALMIIVDVFFTPFSREARSVADDSHFRLMFRLMPRARWWLFAQLLSMFMRCRSFAAAMPRLSRLIYFFRCSIILMPYVSPLLPWCYRYLRDARTRYALKRMFDDFAFATPYALPAVFRYWCRLIYFHDMIYCFDFSFWCLIIAFRWRSPFLRWCALPDAFSPCLLTIVRDCCHAHDIYLPSFTFFIRCWCHAFSALSPCPWCLSMPWYSLSLSWFWWFFHDFWCRDSADTLLRLFW